VLCCLSLEKVDARALVRSPAFYSLIVPVAFSVVSFAATGLFTEPYTRMPQSKTAWTESKEASHAAFLSDLTAKRGRKPDLLVATSAEYMTELGVPCFFSYRATSDDGRLYYSRVEMEVWAMIYPADERVLLAKFRRASRSERVDVPAGFPFVVYIFKFTPGSEFSRPT